MAVTVADVATWGKFQVPVVATAEYLLVERTLSAAQLQLSRDFYLDVVLTSDQETALIMQTLRLLSRRNTPEGRSAFGGDIAVTIVPSDADVQALLIPRVGIA